MIVVYEGNDGVGTYFKGSDISHYTVENFTPYLTPMETASETISKVVTHGTNSISERNELHQRLKNNVERMNMSVASAQRALTRSVIGAYLLDHGVHLILYTKFGGKYKMDFLFHVDAQEAVEKIHELMDGEDDGEPGDMELFQEYDEPLIRAKAINKKLWEM